MISYEAVESGARVLIEDGRYGVPWDDASKDDRAEVMAKVRAILEAARMKHTQCEDCGKCRVVAREEWCGDCEYCSCEGGSDCGDEVTK